ncbi:MAG TPA: tetratricopeptide repeat protein [Acidobacteriaceae bacterium]
MSPRSFVHRLVWLMVPAWFALAAAPARAACTGPQALEAKVRAHPTAAGWAELGNWFGGQKNFACAAQALQSAVRLEPRSAQLTYLLGLAYYEQGKFDDAVAPLQRSAAADGTALKPHLLLGSVYVHVSRLAEAEAQWRAALAIDPKSAMALDGLSDALMDQQKFDAVIALLRSAPLDEKLTLELAAAYSQAGLPVQAVDTVSKAMKTYPDSVPLANTLVSLYIKVTRTLDAEKLAEQTYKAHPDDVGVQLAYLHSLVLNGDWTPAGPVGKKLLTETPHDFETLYLNGVLERQEGDYAAARDHLAEAVTLQPNHGSAHANLGIALARLHDAAGAKAELQKAIDLGNPEPETYFELANVLRALGETDAARSEMQQYQEIVKENNNTILAVSKAGEAAQAFDKGDTQHAIDLYREAFTAAPKNALIGYRLATALDKAGDLDGERTALEQVIAIDPTIALAQNQLGYLESQRGDYAAAEGHFRAAVNAAPRFAEAWINLAATLGVESKFSDARQAVETALAIDPSDAQAQQLSHELADAKNQTSKN